MTDSRSQPMTELDEWKQAASVEAGLRREFYDRALTAEAALQEAYADQRKQKVRIEELENCLEKVRSYNVDIAAGRINYRPGDHIAVIDRGLKGEK